MTTDDMPEEEEVKSACPVNPNVFEMPYGLPPKPPANRVPPFVASPRDIP